MLRRLAAVGGRRATARPLSALPRSDDDAAPFCSSTAEQPPGRTRRLPPQPYLRPRDAEPLFDGLDAYRFGRTQRPQRDGRVLRGTGERRRRPHVTGGVAPNREGWVLPLAGKMSTVAEAEEHKVVTDAVHSNGGK